MNTGASCLNLVWRRVNIVMDKVDHGIVFSSLKILKLVI